MPARYPWQDEERARVCGHGSWGPWHPMVEDTRVNLHYSRECTVCGLRQRAGGLVPVGRIVTFAGEGRRFQGRPADW